MFDLADKLEQSEAQLGRCGFMLGMDSHERKSEDKLAKATKDGWVLLPCYNKRKIQTLQSNILKCTHTGT